MMAISPSPQTSRSALLERIQGWNRGVYLDGIVQKEMFRVCNGNPSELPPGDDRPQRACRSRARPDSSCMRVVAGDGILYVRHIDSRRAITPPSLSCRGTYPPVVGLVDPASRFVGDRSSLSPLHARTTVAIRIYDALMEKLGPVDVTRCLHNWTPKAIS